MYKFRTWKQFQATYISFSKKESLDSFFKGELPDSRMIVRNVMSEKPMINFGTYRSQLPRIIMSQK